jgi:hypothetical protein
MGKGGGGEEERRGKGEETQRARNTEWETSASQMPLESIKCSHPLHVLSE